MNDRAKEALSIVTLMVFISVVTGLIAFFVTDTARMQTKHLTSYENVNIINKQ